MEKISYDHKNRPKIVAVDMDGTILHYAGYMGMSEFGSVLRGMIEELKKLKENGWVIVVWTCRKDSPELRAHLEKEGVPFDHVNDHPWNGPENPRKIFADVYVDDKALSFDGIADGLADKIMAHSPWWKDAPWS